MENERFDQIFQRFDEEPLRLGLLSRHVYADSSLVRANVSSSRLSPSGMSMEEFKEKAVDGMLKQLPVKPEIFAADAAYRAGHIRKRLDDIGIVAYIPFHPNQLRNMVAKGGFDYRGDHLVCPEGFGA